jgi:CDP-diacylglycerol--serine O-phosphatidyltransferase
VGLAKHIPNFFTCCNIASGCIGIAVAFDGHLLWAAAWLWVGAVFDFLDGFAARLLGKYSEVGKQLDSLADMVTFGVLPSAIIFIYMQRETSSMFVPFTAFLLAVFAALRLAKFNIDQRQTHEFIGLPTPASAIFISALPLMEYAHPDVFQVIGNIYALLSVIIVLCILMVSEIPMLSLKFSDWKWSGNAYRYVLIITSVVLLLTFRTFGIPMIMILYVFLSLVRWMNRPSKNSNSQPADD